MKRLFSILLLFYALYLPSTYAQAGKSAFLPQSTPEAQGVSSSAITAFLDAAAKMPKLELHDFVILRHGKVIAEGAWKPYDTQLKHTLYSTSKSFTSTAIGFAVKEGRLKLTDKVISFFSKGDLPARISENLAELNIRHLLTMTMGQEPEPPYAAADNWIKPAFAGPVVNKPGSKFLYNNLGPFLLSAIIQKVTGQKLIDYLKPRLFVPLDIKEADYETNPQGINVGGYGLRLNIESMAKFGQLYLQKGKWKGKQILPAEWIAEATKIQIDQAPSYVPEAQKPTSDWAQGYGYFFWRCRNNAYRADGAMGQFIIVMPEQDAVIALTASTADMQAELNLVWDHLLPAMKAGKLAEDPKAQTALKAKISALALVVPKKKANSNLAKGLSGKTFAMESNLLKIQSVSLVFKDDLCVLKLKTDTSSHELSFGSGYWAKGQTTRHGPSLTFGSKGSLEGLPAFKVAGVYAWKDDNTLEMLLRYTESVHFQIYRIKIAGDQIILDVPSSVNSKLNATIKSVR